MASGILLRNRRSLVIGRPQATAVFDRICIESFVYHASLMMIFDPSLDALSDIRCRQELSELLSDSVHDTYRQSEKSLITQPILHGPYEFFLLIADTTRLARSSNPLDQDQSVAWDQLQRQLLRCRQIMRNYNDKCTELYFLAIQTLLLKSNPGLPEDRVSEGIASSLRKGNLLIPQIQRSHYFPSFLLWPLAIFGSVSATPDEVTIIREYVSRLAESRLGGQASWVLNRLENIWASTVIQEAEPALSLKSRVAGLQNLLDGEQVT